MQIFINGKIIMYSIIYEDIEGGVHSAICSEDDLHKTLKELIGFNYLICQIIRRD